MDLSARPPHQLDYHRRAQRRQATRPPSISATATASATVRTSPPYRRPAASRYAALGKPAAPAPDTSAPHAPSPTPLTTSSRVLPPRPSDEADELQTLSVSLKDEFARVRDGQQEKREQGRLALRKPRRPVLAGIATLGLVALVIAGVVIGPLLYRGSRAYQEVFEEPVPHSEAPFVAAVNPEGTKVIVEATAPPAVELPEWNGKDRITILLLGVDRREDEPSRSDTMILVNFDPVAKTAGMLAIPRDLKVIVPGYGVHKINAAYAFGDADKVPGGGPGLTIRTIETNFGIRVDHYAQVDFAGFTKIIDTVGGLTLDVPYPIKDDAYPGPGNQYMRVYFQTGWQHMDGARVLQYARTRHDDGDGRRSVRQQQVLLALRDQAVSLDLLPKAPELLTQVGDAVRTDLQPTQALMLARLASEIDPAAIVQYTLNPALTEEELPGEPYYLLADWDQIGAIMTEFTGVQTVPPMSALANPDHSLRIRIEDGTVNPGLGDRVAAVLKANGFRNVTVADAADLGSYPTSTITADRTDLSTAYLIAGVLGIDLSAITVADTGALTTASPATGSSPVATPIAAASPVRIDAVALFPTPTGEAAPSERVIVIVLGNDAPDPANFTAEPFSDETVPIEDAGIDAGAVDQTGGDAAVGNEETDAGQ